MAPGIDEEAGKAELSGLGAEALLEALTIEQVPVNQRHGRGRHLFNIWFGVNVMPLTLVMGVLATSVFHLNFAMSVVAIILGNAAGGVVMALHSAQGPRLGVPQLIQTRGQFGARGSLLVIGIALVMYLGFLASILVLAGQSANQLVSPLSINWGIVLGAIVTLLIVVFGYDIIHKVNRYLLPLFGLAVVLAVIWIMGVHGLPSNFMSRGSVTLGGFLGALSTVAIWQISYAPYVSDYSRYLPIDSNKRTAFLATYGGTMLSSIPLMVAGAIVGIVTTGANVLSDVSSLTGPVGWFVILMFLLGAVDACIINLYGPMLCIVTAGQTFRTHWLPGARARITVSTVFVAVATFIAIEYQSNFLIHFTDFITVLLYALIPWSAINLVDYYLIRRGAYDVDSFFKPGGGIYGNYNWVALAVYVLGIAVEIPFMTTTFYVGIVAQHLNGGDLTWVAGLIFTVPVFYFVGKWQQSRQGTVYLSGTSQISGV